MNIADVTIHVDQSLDIERRSRIVETLKEQAGVSDVISKDDRPHLLIVRYDPAVLSSKSILQVVLDSGVHAELIGF